LTTDLIEINRTFAHPIDLLSRTRELLEGYEDLTDLIDQVLIAVVAARTQAMTAAVNRENAKDEKK
jgi:hypothetical protein